MFEPKKLVGFLRNICAPNRFQALLKFKLATLGYIPQLFFVRKRVGLAQKQ